ncbi:MAG: hypothetical protein VB934_12015 [Polyangiaceae bacterium]
MEQAPPITTDPRKRLATIAKGALYLVVCGAIIRIVEVWLNNPMSGAVIGAAIVSVLVGRAGLDSAPLNRERWAHMAKLALQGAAPIVAVAVIAIAIGEASVRTSPPGPSMLFGTVESLGLAYRDELWLHGLILLFAKRAAIPPRWAVLYATVASAAAIVGVAGTTAAGLVLTAGASLWLASLWQTRGDAWLPVAAHFGWAWMATTILSGDPFDLNIQRHVLPYGPSASGWMAWAAAACFFGFGLKSLSRLDEDWTQWPA